MKFKKGQITDKVWSGDIVTSCEYLDDLGQGRMLFFDKTFKCFRCVYWEYDVNDNKFYLNGWVCAGSPSSFKRLKNC